MLLSLNCLIVLSSLSDIVLMLIPSSFISFSVSEILYFLLKSNFDILLAISFNCNIGSVNFFDTNEEINADIKIVIPPITSNTSLEILTLSSIGTTGILIYKLYPLHKVPSNKI